MIDGNSSLYISLSFFRVWASVGTLPIIAASDAYIVMENVTLDATPAYRLLADEVSMLSLQNSVGIVSQCRLPTGIIRCIFAVNSTVVIERSNFLSDKVLGMLPSLLCSLS